MKQHLVVFSGAGVSADSGLSTFRDADGLWEKYRIEDVCTPEALVRNPQLVLDFYNARRRQLDTVMPNAAHRAIAELERYFDVDVITQNVDDLHERAGSTRVCHLHGELRKCRSSSDPTAIYPLNRDLKVGDLAEDSTQLRPHIVFFGEAVPEYERALEIVQRATILLVVGTSLAVYPAAGLIYYAPASAAVYVVDPSDVQAQRRGVTYVRKRAAEGVPEVTEQLISQIGKIPE